MSRLINQLTGEPEEKEPAAPKPQQLELLGSLPLSIKDPPSITAPVPPRNQPLARNRNKTPGEPVLAPPEEMDRMRTALVDAEARARSAEAAVDRVRQEAESVRAALRQESEERMESLRLEVASLQDSRDGERKSRLAGEQRIRDLEEQLRSLSATPREESEEARQALDAAHTQLDDLRSQFRHLESSHETQSAQAEQRVRELTSALEREKRSQAEARRELTELQAERDRLSVEIEGLRETAGAAEESVHLRARLEEVESRWHADAEVRARGERQVAELKARVEALEGDLAQAHDRVRAAQEEAAALGRERGEERRDLAQKTEALESRRADLERQLRQAEVERDEAVEGARKARVQLEQETARFQERERLANQRLAALRRPEPPPEPAPVWNAWPVWMVTVLVLSLGAFWLGRRQGADRGVAPDPAASAITPGSGAAAPTAPPVVAAAPQPVEWPVLKANFMRTQTGTDRLTIIFEYAVFSRRTEVHPDALRDLQKLARQLAGLTGEFRFEVTGHTDSDPVSPKAGEFGSNLELGLKRAQLIREVLIRQGGLPAESLTAVSAGETNPPYPNTTPDLRRKNRTVTIAILPRGRG